MRKSTKITAALGGTALAVATAGAAYAYWTTSGSGTGSASTREGASAAFVVTGDVANAMFPGDSAQTVTATVKNGGSENYKVQTLKAYVTTGTAGCTGADYLLNGTAAPVDAAGARDLAITPVDLAPDATTTKTFSMQFNNTTANQDACKSAAVTIHYIAG